MAAGASSPNRSLTGVDGVIDSWSENAVGNKSLVDAPNGSADAANGLLACAPNGSLASVLKGSDVGGKEAGKGSAGGVVTLPPTGRRPPPPPPVGGGGSSPPLLGALMGAEGRARAGALAGRPIDMDPLSEKS